MLPIMANPVLVLQESGDPQGLTHSRLPDCGSRQAIQTRSDHPEWSLLPEVFQLICTRWHHPQMVAPSSNNKLPQFVSPAPNSPTWTIDALSLPWENLGPYDQPDQSMKQSGPFLQNGATVIA